MSVSTSVNRSKVSCYWRSKIVASNERLRCVIKRIMCKIIINIE